MKTPPDIYAENPVVDLDYKIAVMQAARDGKTVQARFSQIPISEWKDARESNLRNGKAPDPVFDWSAHCYRIDPACKPQPPKIAAGNNPHKLTEDQVGVGWRLVSKEEIEYRFGIKNGALTKDAQVMRNVQFLIHWEDYPVYMTDVQNTYRTQKPAGYFLPKPKVKAPLTYTDFSAPTIWVRDSSLPSEHALVVRVSPGGIQYSTFLHSRVFTPYGELDGVEYSTDHVNWKPCYKEVEQ